MTTVNTFQLKTQANRLLKQVSNKHQIVVITRRGRPCAALVPVSDESLTDLVWEYSPEVQRRLQIAADELLDLITVEARRHEPGRPLRHYLAERSGRRAKRAR